MKRLLKLFLTVVFAVASFLALGFGIKTNAAVVPHMHETSKGNSDFGISNSVVYDIKEFYNGYVLGKTSSSSLGYKTYTKSGSNIVLHSDAPITAFVEKSCFENAGNYMLIGEEYGYYCRTVSYNNYNLSTVLLLDFSYGKEFGSDKKFYFDVRTVAQNVYATFKYETAYKKWKDDKPFVVKPYEGDIELKLKSDSLLLDTSVTVYRELKYKWDGESYDDGYIVAPVLNSDGRVTTVDNLSITDLNFNIGFVSDKFENNYPNTNIFQDLNFDFEVRDLYFPSVENGWSNLSAIEDLTKEMAKDAYEALDSEIADALGNIPYAGPFISMAIKAHKAKSKIDGYTQKLNNIIYCTPAIEKTLKTKSDVVKGSPTKNASSFSYDLNDYTEYIHNSFKSQIILGRHGDYVEKDGNLERTVEKQDFVRYVIDLNDNAPDDVVANFSFSATPIYKKQVTKVINNTEQKVAEYTVPVIAAKEDMSYYVLDQLKKVNYNLKKVSESYLMNRSSEILKIIQDYQNQAVKETNLLTYMDNESVIDNTMLVKSMSIFAQTTNSLDKILKHRTYYQSVSSYKGEETKSNYVMSTDDSALIYVNPSYSGNYVFSTGIYEAGAHLLIWNAETKELMANLGYGSVVSSLDLKKYTKYYIELRINKSNCQEMIEINKKLSSLYAEIDKLDREIAMYECVLNTPNLPGITIDNTVAQNEYERLFELRRVLLIERYELITKKQTNAIEYELDRKRESLLIPLKIYTKTIDKGIIPPYC